jgi:hypothetical protein
MMKVQRLTPAVLLALGLLMWTGSAWGTLNEDDVALNRVSQIVNLKGVSANGDISFTDLKRVMPDGSEVPFAIPGSRVLLVTRLYFDFKTTSTQTFVSLRMTPFAFWLLGSSIVGGNASAQTTFSTGLTIEGPPNNCRIQAVYNNVVIPGDLTVYMTGLLITPKGMIEPIEYLLLYK